MDADKLPQPDTTFDQIVAPVALELSSEAACDAEAMARHETILEIGSAYGDRWYSRYQAAIEDANTAIVSSLGRLAMEGRRSGTIDANCQVLSEEVRHLLSTVAELGRDLSMLLAENNTVVELIEEQINAGDHSPLPADFRPYRPGSPH